MWLEHWKVARKINSRKILEKKKALFLVLMEELGQTREELQASTLTPAVGLAKITEAEA